MAIFLPEENHALKGNTYPIPKGLRQKLAVGFLANKQYKDIPGYKKAVHMCNPKYNDRSKGTTHAGKKGLPYGSLKRLKNTLDYADPKSLEYNLIGGDDMKSWVNDTLNRERTKVQPENERKKSEHLKNNTKVVKPFQSGDLKINIHESTDYHPYWNYLEDYSQSAILEMFQNKEKPWTPLIPPEQYKKALQEFTQYGQFMRFPGNKVYQWFGIIMKNTAILRAITDFAGHSQYLPLEEFLDAFFYDYESSDINYEKWNQYKEERGDDDDDYGAMIDYLDDLHFFEWFQLPDGSDPWSDMGIQRLEKIINEYNENKSPEEILVLLNKTLDIAHCRGDLASIFIQGGSKTLSQISESIKKDSHKTIHLTEQQINKLKELLN